jgi:Protein of unknown function (DUF3995)
MDAGLVVTAVSLVSLAVGHSALGETKLLGPLLRAGLPPLPVPAAFAGSVLRLAWHVTSLAWLGLGVVVLVAPQAAWVVAVVMAISGVVTHVMTKGAHFAWALFMLGALGVAFSVAAGAGRTGVAVTGALVAFALAGLHLAWAAGLTWGLAAAIPQVDGRPAFQPGRVATLAVTAALGALGTVFLALGGVLTVPFASALGLVAALVFIARTVGDFRTVGLFKKVRAGPFAANDSLLYTPLCFSLAAALLWLR